MFRKQSVNYETFKETILQQLSEDIPDPKHITIRKVYRNNGESLDGLVILENGVNIGPTLYLNYYFQMLEGGDSFASIYRRIFTSYTRNKTTEHIDVGFFTDFDRVRGRIVPKLIHGEKNKGLLEKEIPHIPFLDLALVFCCLFPVDPEIGNATILVDQSHLTLWKKATEDLFPLAMENAGTLLAPKLQSMDQMLAGMLTEEEGTENPFPTNPRLPMYVLTNEEGFFGAACMAYDGLMRSYAEQFQSGFYILPSSIHELILIPAEGTDRLEEFSEMVREVNETQVAPEDILSDHAYYYSPEEDTILY